MIHKLFIAVKKIDWSFLGCSRSLSLSGGYNGKQSHNKELGLFWPIGRHHRQKLWTLFWPHQKNLNKTQYFTTGQLIFQQSSRTSLFKTVGKQLYSTCLAGLNDQAQIKHGIYIFGTKPPYLMQARGTVHNNQVFPRILTKNSTILPWAKISSTTQTCEYKRTMNAIL